MTEIALFHSILGVRPGVLDAADRLRAAGHRVRVVDQYDGRVFDDYAEAEAFIAPIGYPALMDRALAGVDELPDGFMVAGFSNGAGMAEYVATQRKVSGVVMLSGAIPVDTFGVLAWPAGVPAQIHYRVEDPFREQVWLDRLAEEIRDSGSSLELFDYPGRGHLFTDPSLPDEYDAQATELLWSRVLPFCAG